MQYIKTIFVLVIAVCCLSNMGYAQEISKEELKLWKNKAKEFKKDPLKLKALVEEAENLEPEIDRLNQALREMRKSNASLEAQLNQSIARQTSLEGEIQQLNSQLSATQQQLSERPKSAPTTTSSEIETTTPMVNGVVFKVQIGAYKKRRMDTELANSDNLGIEEEEGYQKVVVGQFRDIEQAKKLREELEVMGVKGAWVVPYRDGVRITLQEALN